ncbi:GNAT family N-acetyltransferase [Roseomonas sp. M0104]|uniref:GNAT family N-acetyltransferase n=1 Tax=Teichococcus coralli TaxID=2545983 RepID=A0A845BB64_9PROT|nr:GNAT family N-acetyltransferase [Pseudoroseomonas coralli]MXP64401.1 GNAT family N-acetyltransferase [Pseudoroseomonas coralli]
MHDAWQIRPLAELPVGIEALRAEAVAEGFRFMDRLVMDWHAGTNRFDGAGEVLLGAFDGDTLLAVGGLNRDPYASEEGVGRLRHLYVARAVRRRGIASLLVAQLLRRAQDTFRIVRLRTETGEAARFYARQGFARAKGEAASHVLVLAQRRKPGEER